LGYNAPPLLSSRYPTRSPAACPAKRWTLYLLIVDDDQALREVLTELFHIEGLTCFAVPGLDAGIAALANEAFDLVLTDSFGRTLDASALAELRSLVTAAEPTPVVLMTAHGEAARIAEDEYGLAGVILKPFDFNDVLALVHRLVPSSSKAPG
jgi:DNA-binding NtrC family response regulator